MGSPWNIGFALTLLMLPGILPTVGIAGDGTAVRSIPEPDLDRNGIEDALDRWLVGACDFTSLRDRAEDAAVRARRVAGVQNGGKDGGRTSDDAIALETTASGAWSRGHLRLLVLDAIPAQVGDRAEAAAGSGVCRVVRSMARFGGVTVLEVDEAGLRALLTSPPDGRILLDRDGVPALMTGRALVGVPGVTSGAWRLGDDWSSSIAILDSGCDTAHGDLGDHVDDDVDGPPPGVGDAGDWYASDMGWPLFSGYKVIGWHDVTDDFPLSVGPWDYHHHGTALASVAAGSGSVEADLCGVAPGARLTVVKFYDFDGTWHAWAGDFLAACAWALDHRDIHRIGAVLMAVNWDADLGLSRAVQDLVEAGMTPVAAIGNHGDAAGWPGLPASLPDVLTLGAVNDAGAVAAFSGRGHPGGSKPDLLAPGGGLLQAGGRIECADNEPDDTYSGRYGTSLAAAYAAGAIHLLDEALRESGLELPRSRSSVLLRHGLLKMTAAPVTATETADGTGIYGLGPHVGFDPTRGWGLLRIDAAVRAVLHPLLAGRDQTDTLTVDWGRPVLARRLGIQPGIRYLVEAVPAVGLDVSLEIVDPTRLIDDPWGDTVIRQDANGAGVSEFTYVNGNPDGWLFLSVKRITGAGTVVLRLREADSFIEQGAGVLLPGILTGSPAVGQVSPFAGPSLVVPSRVAVDQVARSLNVLDLAGNPRPGWPSFVFPNVSAQGGLGQPLVWDLDGVAGDEIVVASDFGSVYFFDAAGDAIEVVLALNQALTIPAGLEAGGGQRRVVIADKMGDVRAWSHGAVLEAQTSLGHVSPLAPAVGRLLGDVDAVVVAFADGFVTALDEDLQELGGWPVSLGTALSLPPVLCDFDADGRHEVVIPVLDAGVGTMTMRVLDGQGVATELDGARLAAPGDGAWLAAAPPLVAGSYVTEDLHVAVAGLGDNGLTGDRAVWRLGLGSLAAGGARPNEILPGLQMRATTTEGNLVLDTLLLPTPLAWSYRGGWGTEPAVLVHARWNELIYGLTSIPGATLTWCLAGNPAEPITDVLPLHSGGAMAEPVGALGGLILPLTDDVLLRLEIVDAVLGITPVVNGYGGAPLWAAARADSRNSGAYPLRQAVAATPVKPLAATRLSVHPNPGSGRFRFHLAGGADGGVLEVDIFDLRGRRVDRLRTESGRDGNFAWDGTDRAGRPLAAGTYLAVVRGAVAPAATRVTITR